MKVKKNEKRRPGAFTTIPGRFLKKYFGAFGPPGRYKKSRKKKAHTSHTHPATTARQQQQQQQVLIMSQPSSTGKAAITDKSTAVFGSLSVS